MRQLTLFFILITSSYTVLGQYVDSTQYHQIYVKSYSDLISVSPNAHNNIETFNLKSPGYHLELYPNTSIATSLKLSYDFLVLSISTSPAFINYNNDSDLKGETKIIKYSTNLSLGTRFNQYLFYQKTNGYYVNNTDDFIPDWTSNQAYITIPDLKYISLGGTTTFITNKNYSLFAFNAINQKQTKSAGSFIHSLSYGYFIIDNETALSETSSSQRNDNVEINLISGYNYTWVVQKNLFLASGISSGVGITRTKLTTRFPENRYQDYSNQKVFIGSGFFSFGFDNGTFFSGASINGSFKEYFQPNTDAVFFDDSISFEIYLGYRFKAPNSLKKGFNRFKEFLPLL